MRGHVALIVIVGLTLLSVGCVERRLMITSEPAGALVYLNDEEVGRTPLEVPFTWYGTYDVRLEREGYRTLQTQQVAEQPWWEVPGPDLFAETIPNKRVEIAWHLEMTPRETPPPIGSEAWNDYLELLLGRAGTLRELNRRD
ncbi:MAG: PEGA domain-containing protein [Planctomycetota bacterium]